jgi:hypothetical protein
MLFEAGFRSPVAPRSGSLITIEKKCTHAARQGCQLACCIRASPLDRPLAIVLSTAPSLRSDKNIALTLTAPDQRPCAGEAQELCPGKHHDGTAELLLYCSNGGYGSIGDFGFVLVTYSSIASKKLIAL